MSTGLTTIAAPETGLVHGSSLWSDAWFRLKKNRLALFGLGFFLFMICICVLGPFSLLSHPLAMTLLF
jgi:oligopeptide transport system permease protein